MLVMVYRVENGKCVFDPDETIHINERVNHSHKVSQRIRRAFGLDDNQKGNK